MRELDALIAEKYEGWKWTTSKNISILVHPALHKHLIQEKFWKDGIHGEKDLETKSFPNINPFPHYCTDMNALLKLNLPDFELSKANDMYTVKMNSIEIKDKIPPTALVKVLLLL